MNISFNVTGKERKTLAQAIAELTYSEMEYSGAPTFAYRIGDYTVDKNGTVFYPDTVAPEATTLLVEKLKERGFAPKSTGEPAPANNAAETPDVAPTPVPDAQPEEAITEPTEGAETPDTGEEATEEEAPMEETAEEIAGDVKLEEESGEDAANNDDDKHITITLPKADLPDDVLLRLRQIIANKADLFKRAVAADTLPIVVTDETVSFPWFTATGMAGEEVACAQFIQALCRMAKEQKRVLDKPYNGDNDRFAMRIFMVRLGMKGAEYAVARKLLMQNLSGNSGWRYGAPAETIPIYWNDLTPEKQQELFNALGDNGNYDVHPLAEIPVPAKEMPEEETGAPEDAAEMSNGAVDVSEETETVSDETEEAQDETV